MTLTRVFLDTNVYIVGAADPGSDEARILRWVGLETGDASVQVVMSDDVLDQIRRVGRRLGGKDWAGALLSRIWRNLKLSYTTVTSEQLNTLLKTESPIPREDLLVYLTAKNGVAECFVSYNHELVRALAKAESAFEALTPAEFVNTYITE